MLKRSPLKIGAKNGAAYLGGSNMLRSYQTGFVKYIFPLLVEERLQHTGHGFGGDDVSLPVERVSFGLGDGSGYRFRGAVEEVGREACELGLGGRTLGDHQDRLSDAGKSVRGDLVAIEDHGILDERVGERDG